MRRAFVIWLVLAAAAYAGITLVGTLVMTFVSPLLGYAMYVAGGLAVAWWLFRDAVATGRRAGELDAHRTRAVDALQGLTEDVPASTLAHRSTRTDN